GASAVPAEPGRGQHLRVHRILERVRGWFGDGQLLRVPAGAGSGLPVHQCVRPAVGSVDGECRAGTGADPGAGGVLRAVSGRGTDARGREGVRCQGPGLRPDPTVRWTKTTRRRTLTPGPIGHTGSIRG